MAIYSVVQEVLLFPYTYLESTGDEAKHDTAEEDLAVDERGNPKREYAAIKKSEGRLLYEDSTDWDKLTNAEKEKAFYASNPGILSRYVAGDAVVDTGR